MQKLSFAFLLSATIHIGFAALSFAQNTANPEKNLSASASPTPVAMVSPTPAPESKEQISFPRVFVGVNLTTTKLEFSSNNTNVDAGFTLGYLFTPHHQANVTYSGQSFTARSLSTNLYRASYRFNLGQKPATTFFFQAHAGLINIATGNSSNSYSVIGADLGKNFQLFGDSNFVLAPTVGFEKTEGAESVVKVVPINFGFYFL